MIANLKLGSPRVGLALSGGAIRGAAHIGVLKIFEAQDIRIDCISGTSIGAMIAALYAFGKSPAEIEAIARDFNWLDISKFILPKLGLLSNEEMGDMLHELLGPVNVENAPIPLAIVATDINTGEKIVFRQGSVAHAVMASTCIPGIFTPINDNGRLLVDGLLVENVPISPLQKMSADIILAVDLSGDRQYKQADDIIDVIMNSFEIAVDTTTLYQLKAADVVIQPKVSEFSRTDTSQVGELIRRGEIAALVAVPVIRDLIERKRRTGFLDLLKQWMRRPSRPIYVNRP
ncbi:MAG: patatin-like phospholipase family protein [candidate division KSB1 bacterium]|nr:patatin-like phospholipase family protein [candidate division KSB1 bacterium]